MNIQIGFGVVWSGQRIHEEVAGASGCRSVRCGLDWGEFAASTMRWVGEQGCPFQRWWVCVLRAARHEYSLHDLENFLGVRKLCETECSIFPLAKDVGPLSDQGAVMREDLSGVMPVVETGQGAVEIVVSILNVLGKGGVILYGFSALRRCKRRFRLRFWRLVNLAVRCHVCADSADGWVLHSPNRMHWRVYR
jgi:hypothetical protein